ncbi:MAG: tRNA (adenosine(37)-N6)-threonylcarbamoyltransferase complex dimerization subunit type 1 TsaB [Planctomycetota bacterium]|nr:tRNA (adenosine(37)-N6)-threonylcarbamoyltransferase complex dimerization subunit type 1 TsaB [Planctomycetota bacterium]
MNAGEEARDQRSRLTETSPMHLLAIETSGPLGGIALLATEGDGEPTLLEEVYLQEGFRHARDLLPTIRAACDRAGWSPRAVDALAVSIGPGSFTGVRIAVILAKFMAYDAAAAIVPVPSLRAMAASAPPDRSPLACIRDAKRGGLYASIFARRGGDLEETFGPALIQPEALAERLQPGTLVLGRGVPKAREALAAFDLAPEALWDVQPSAVARIGHRLWQAGATADPLRLEPIYLRRPEAEEVWERRHGGADR